MAMKVPKAPLSNLLKDGSKMMQGVEEAVMRNITACKELSNLTRTSMGPNGMNKMVVNHLEKLFVTSDAATMMKELEVAHPAAKLLVLASQQQEVEMGDMTNFVVIFAGELLSHAEDLLRMGLKPSEVVDGYERAVKRALDLLEEVAFEPEGDVTQAAVLRPIVQSAIASKQYGMESFLTSLVVDACIRVMPKQARHFNIDSVRVVKILGASTQDSRVVNGMVFGREPEGAIRSVKQGKVAVFSCPLDTSRTETKGTVLIHDAKEMLSFSQGEEASLEKEIKALAEAGVKVLVTGSAVGELAMHYVNRYEMMIIKILSKFDLRRLCKVTGATPLARVGVPTAEEMGYVDVVETVEIGSDRCTVFRQEHEDSKTVSVVVRGGTTNVLDDIERAIDDGVNVVKAVLKGSKLLYGAGASDLEVAHRLQAFATKTPGLAQYAIDKFGLAFEAVPATLAENAGMDVTETLSQLYAAHQAGQFSAGVDIENNGILDSKAHSIFDTLEIKRNALRLATHAALTVLRIDQIIMSKPAGGPKAPKKPAFDEDD